MNPPLSIQSLAVPADAEFPGSVQGYVDLIAAYLRIIGGDAVVNINFGSSTPSSDDRDKPWFKTSPSGAPVGWYSWTGSTWAPTSFPLTRGTTAQRPAAPAEGTPYFDADINCALIFERARWRTLHGSPGDIKYVAKATLAEAITANPGWKEFTDARGRVLGAAGAGPGLTERAYNEKTGDEEVSLSIDQIPAHAHQTVVNPKKFRASIHDIETVAIGGGETTADPDSYKTSSVGGGQAHSNMQPTIFVWCLVKE